MADRFEESINLVSSNVTTSTVQTKMTIAKQIIKDAIDEQNDESFFVVNLEDVFQKYKRFQKALPRVKPFYVLKSNADRVLLLFIARLGLGFDCASKKEIEQVLDLGVHPDKIIFAHICKQISSLKYAKSKDVFKMTFDHEYELVKIKNVYTDISKPELLVRIRVKGFKCMFPMSSKFGATVPEAKKLLKRAKEMKLRIVGVSFHVGSGQLVPSAYEQAIRDASELFRYGREELDFTGMNLLDIGGGFPGSMSDHDIRLFEEQAAVINESLEKYFGDIGDLEVIAEPGRYFAASAYTLATPIISRKITDSDHHVSYYVSESIYGSFRTFFMHPVNAPTPFVISEKTSNDTTLSTILGFSSEDGDVLKDSVSLPLLEPLKDWLVWEDMGAYTTTVSGNFSGLKMGRPYIYYGPKIILDLAYSAMDCNKLTKLKFFETYGDLPRSVKVEDGA
ncbi:hypothetical protein ACOME3_005158 [Neoechinorhynchus agilis]